MRADVPNDWPPGEYDRGAIEFILNQLNANWPAMDGWSSWYGLLEGAPAEHPSLVGVAGYFGPPDEHGSVEIGYSVASRWRKLGFATEMVRGLLWRAAESGDVTSVQAHCLPGNDASIAVLVKSGFEEVASDEPGQLRFEYKITRP
ncbi:MAG: GNAT family N-acetyltransferase [Candidatus Eremiobacteraeota bacterium]|nr:GNAT family N-acetyltransferase [Candidatus Eremiobacteraeota bacterium]